MKKIKKILFLIILIVSFILSNISYSNNKITKNDISILVCESKPSPIDIYSFKSPKFKG